MTKKVFLDPGHGGQDPGAVANGLQEKDIVLQIARRTRDILLNEYSGVQVRLSRENDVFIALSERARLANSWGADYFSSVHVNAGGGTGFESYRFNGTTSQATVANQNVLHNEIIRAVKVVDRGKKAKNFVVLRETNMPAVLLEFLFIDNSADAALLRKPAFLELCARSHAEGLANIFGLQRKGGGNVSGNKPSSWAEASWKKALLKGVMNEGQGPKEPLTREQLAVIFDRIGMLE
ncbi:N-acetylmuramoyl-L-alanine amidase family protein [Halalkalibacter oceani]|uniref:N-acetylmuramoyl-L-alanine amidase family protein n=1 Tax=Halalkalibacter oceani TaxID=1653776 RepID=UPI0033935F09